MHKIIPKLFLVPLLYGARIVFLDPKEGVEIHLLSASV